MALDPLTAGFDLAKAAVERIWPDKSEQEKQEAAMVLTMMQGQLAVNQAEASNNSLIVAGWRPAVGWVCAFAFGFKFIGGPLLVLVAQYLGHTVVLPQFDYSEMSTVLIGMLGLGAYRSFDKAKGTA